MSNAITVRDDISPALSAMAVESPQALKRAMLALGQRYRKRISTEFRAGNPAGQPFAPLSPVTLQLRKMKLDTIKAKRRQMRAEGVAGASKRGRSLTRARSMLQGFGGVLPTLAEFQTQTGVRVGFLGILRVRSDRAVARYQRAESRPYSKAELHKWHKLFGKTLPERSYNRPRRAPVSPFEDSWNTDALGSIRKTFEAVKYRYAK